MAIFAKESVRLLREHWKNPLRLAQELYAILNSDEPLQISGPVTITNTTGQPAITINQVGGASPVIEVRRTTPSSNSAFDIPPITIPSMVGQGFRVYMNYDGTWERTEFDQGSKPQRDNPPKATKIETGGGGGGFPGMVISGSGKNYRVGIQTADGTKEVDVIQVQIANDAQIPAGTGVIVVKTGDLYFMQVAVWL